MKAIQTNIRLIIQGIHFMLPCSSCPVDLIMITLLRAMVTTLRMGNISRTLKASSGLTVRSMPRNMTLKFLMLSSCSGVSRALASAGRVPACTCWMMAVLVV